MRLSALDRARRAIPRLTSVGVRVMDRGRGPTRTLGPVDLLSRFCKAHELDNLYLADASFFPSIGAVNPTLTIIANALRVADKIKLRLGA